MKININKLLNIKKKKKKSIYNSSHINKYCDFESLMKIYFTYKF